MKQRGSGLGLHTVETSVKRFLLVALYVITGSCFSLLSRHWMQMVFRLPMKQRDSGLGLHTVETSAERLLLLALHVVTGSCFSLLSRHSIKILSRLPVKAGGNKIQSWAASMLPLQTVMTLSCGKCLLYCL